MPTYDYVCDKCQEKWEVHISMEIKDGFKWDCPICGNPLRQKYQWPLAQVWAGKFHDRWYQIHDNDGLGSTW